MMKRPAVVHVERRFGQFVGFVLILGEREHMRVCLMQIGHRPVPEVRRHFARYIAAETVDTDTIHPPMHRFEHLIAHVLVVVVELGNVRPVVLNHQVSEAVAVMPSLVLRPFAVRSGVVGYPVENDLKTLFVGCFEEMLEVSTRTELRVDGAVVDDRIITAERTLTGDFANRLAGHYPNDVDAVFLQFGQQGLCRGKSAFRCCLTGVQLIDGSVIRPFGVTQLFVVGAADESQCSQRKQKCFFHISLNFILSTFNP